jgi:hypothetical protein
VKSCCKRKSHNIKDAAAMIREFRCFDRASIADLIHDRFFDIEAVSVNHNTHQMQLFYYADGSLTTIEGKITVKHVINVKIIETERIQYYDFNYIQWIEKEKKLKVITNIPLTFEIFVTEFEIKIEN